MKPLLVIIHGWTKSGSDSFKEVAEILKNDFEMILIDLPGFKTPINRPYTFDDYLNFLEEKLRNLENFYLLGHSFGGALAMLYSLRFPQKIKTLILYAPAIIRRKTIKQKIFNFLAKIFKPAEQILTQKLSFFLKKMFYRIFVGSYDYFLFDENMKKTMANINQDLSEKAKEIKVKTILLWGEKDKITPFKDAHTLKNLISSSKLITFVGGHSYHKENPEEFAKIVKNIV
ncbi:MAG: 2-hydroxy-6-oxohepta-2,4-dienoate hydrolase [Candidatus Parcubacteria bacterium]|nr:MAG: 2-hydroxy-6-oxohepta-2,4-dienoate hydrolase [Candidatus Parcubacteria bacterium]GIW67122.1 MAG: 2-hydroxy-6-oxohepta-2,4-dienoate hydrolase [Candidatus Parcubacteria bacterium]GIW67313.1 MAG: 2-hydroxy-6-oxohepta-2,4-dienoate hydrolase [Candidatus Parcubacteria bacterium]